MSALSDDHVRDLVTTTGLGRTLFVEAGAGTGKTTQLVTRIVNLVLEQGVSLASIAAITFTEAAAAELQSRIRVKFEETSVDAERDGDDERLARCRTAIDEADKAVISTLHGFASRMLGEFPVDAGLPPRIRVLDEVSSQLAHEERWERFVDRLYDDPANEALLLRAALLDVRLESRFANQATFKKVALQLNQHWDRLESVAAATPPPIGPVDFTPFEAAVDALARLVDECTDVDDLLYVKLTGTLLPQAREILDLDDPDRRLRALGAASWSPGRGGRKGAWPCDIDAVKQALADVGAAAEQVHAEAVDPVLRHLLVLVAREVRDAARARQADGGLEFHDLLVLARELLRTSAHARSTLHDRYTHLLLDEFQDTDPIQIELATLIAATIIDGTPGEWDELDVDHGRLFFVGDPKQSIYRFRRADIGLFLQARTRFGAIDGVQQLVTNFRTVEPIIHWVNHLFHRVMGDGQDGYQPRYEPLAAHRAGERSADHRPVLLGGPHPDPKVRAGVLRQDEAADVARAIDHIRANPSAWPVFDERTRLWRGAHLSDVTILVPARTSVPFLRTALGRAGIPYRLATGTLVYDTQEVRDALAAIRAIDDPTDQLSLVAALRSPLYACTDVDLYRYRSNGGRWALHRSIPDTVPEDCPVRAAMAHLRSLWEDRWWLTPSALLGRLLRERHAELLAFGDPRPEEVWRRLRFLVDQARSFEEAGGGGLRAFVDWAVLQSADGARVHEPLLPETGDDAVQILTIHGSKGLEFPITILSGLTTQPGRRPGGVSVLWDEEGNPELSMKKNVATSGHEPRADIEEEMDVHEKLRLLYVAATRGRDHLIVSCHHKAGDKPSGTYAERVWTNFTEHPDLWRELPEADGPEIEVPAPLDGRDVPSLTDRTTASEAEAARGAWIARREALIAPQRRPRVLSATTVAGLGHRAAGDPDAEATVDEDDTGDDLPTDGAVTPRRRGRAGSAIGRAVHATLQLIDLAAPRDVEAQARRQCELEGIGDLTDDVVAMVRSTLDSPIIRMAAAGTHHKELFVAAPVGDRTIEGYVDLLIETPDGLVIVDYKTDAVRSDADADARLAHHRLQGAAYALALTTTTGLPVVGCHFVFCGKRGSRERSITDLEAAVAEVRALLAA